MKKDNYKYLNTFNLSKFIKSRHASRKLKCIIFGNFGAMNLGDEAILTGQINELKKVKDIKISAISRFPSEINRLHKIQSIQIYNLFKIITSIYKTDFVIIGGGGILCKNDRMILGIFYQLYMLAIYFFIPKILKKSVYVVGLGIYTNSSKLILSLATRLLRQVSFISVRDFHSYDFLKSKNINVKIYKDSSFLMNLSKIQKIKSDKFFVKNYKKNNNNIGLALLRPDNLHDEEILINKIINFVKSNKSNTVYWFYSCDFQKGFYNDYMFAEKVEKSIKDEISSTIECHFIPLNWTPQRFFSSFKLMDYFITMRLHASIFAYRNKLNFLAISYDEKCSSFLRSIGKKPVSIKNINIPLHALT